MEAVSVFLFFLCLKLLLLYICFKVNYCCKSSFFFFCTSTFPLLESDIFELLSSPFPFLFLSSSFLSVSLSLRFYFILLFYSFLFFRIYERGFIIAYKLKILKFQCSAIQFLLCSTDLKPVDYQ